MSTRETRSTSKTNQRRAAISEVMAHEETPAWAQHLLTEFTNFRTSFDTKMTEVTNSVKDLKKETRTMNNRISEIETRTGSLEDELNASNERVKSLTKDVGDLQRKVDNMTAEYRKKNLIFMGLPEGLEKTPGELDNILRYVLDLKEGEATPEIEAQRRALKPKPKPDIYRTHPEMGRQAEVSTSGVQEAVLIVARRTFSDTTRFNGGPEQKTGAI